MTLLKRAALELERVVGDALFAVFDWWWCHADDKQPLWTWEDEESL